MPSKPTKKSKDKNISSELKSKKSIDKLKKKKRSVADEKINAEKKLKKLKDGKGKKSKLKKLKELLVKLLKKEKKVASKLKKSKNDKKIIKDLKKGKKASKSIKEKKIKKSKKYIVDTHIEEAEAHSEPLSTSPKLTDQSIVQPLNHSSLDHLAKEAIAHVRKLDNAQDIDLFVLGDKRDTVLKAAQSRKNRIARQ